MLQKPFMCHSHFLEHAGICIEVIHDLLYSQVMIEEEKWKMKKEIENQIYTTIKAIKCFLPPQGNKSININSNWLIYKHI